MSGPEDTIPQPDAGGGPAPGTTLEKEPASAGPGGAGPGPDYAPAGPREGKAGRFWATRRAPAAVTALLLLAGLGFLLYDVASVRAGRPGMAWRRTLADELATRRLDDVFVMAGAAVAAALGLWLLVLALTPGRRSLLTMRPELPQVRAGLERSAAALVLRDRAMEVPGVQAVRVKVSRRKVRARALAHFRDLEEVRSDLGGALGDGIDQLGLARRPGLSVRVRRPGK
ncbi:DUF6286 domain-containing protein [Streptomyces albus]|uniref:DUF6286 domain-containing protein n=1 Tax=Streptomyces sp. NRRL F-5639 TaxID=1463867 RepID=UPI0004CB84B7|nr:DUF6286 domain-containing protein [Streptomyces sp. NRRL F-5639]KPC93563.1 membrane protein [Streptomyces sp. NRRL F-6602]